MDEPRNEDRRHTGPWSGRRARHSGRGRWAGGPRHAPGPGFFGCLLLAIVGFVGIVTALATWIAASLVGWLAPGATASAVTAVAVIVVVVLLVGVGARSIGSAIRPLAEIAAATERLADGAPGIRVHVRGPRPVRSLVTSFNAMAERLDRSRDDRRALLADVAHELRTPLTVVAGGIEAMLDGVHPTDEDHLAPLLAETRTMDRLLDDLRTLSLADAGALALHREPCDLRLVADEVVAANARLAAVRSTTLRTGGDAALEANVDPVRVREILANLVANALRHTPDGGTVIVSVAVARDEAVLTVTDTGGGIASDDLERVFDRFHRRADSGGSGLGLAIVRDLAVAHGGSVAVTSEGLPGRGSRFEVRLPLRD